jgi:D-glycero-D-manno-heptose 1,7-bisphosphate phosphatase
MSEVANKALFLDRDGVINIERCYVHRRQDFSFQEGIFDLCQAAQSLGYLLLVVTNQAGIARGYYTESEFLELTEWMIGEFARQRIAIVRVYYCPYHPLYGVGKYKRESADRKPRPGMLLRAQADFNLDLRSSIVIGDKLSDIEAGRTAGVGTRIMLDSKTTGPSVEKGDYYLTGSLYDVCSRFFAVSHDGAGLTRTTGALLRQIGRPSQ